MHHQTTLIVFVAVFCATMLVGYFIRQLLFHYLLRYTAHTSTEIDDILVSSLKRPFLLLCAIISLYVALNVSNMPSHIEHVINTTMRVLTILLIALAVANITARFIRHFARRLETTLPVTSLTQNTARIIIMGMGALIILRTVGISITPILATLGVGGIAVALALQDTLANLFAGIHIIATKLVNIGDYVKLSSGEEGYVVDINWRTTKIRMLANNMVIIPNDKIAKTIITNYYVPDKALAVLIDIGVHYKSDLAHVEAVTCAVAKEVMREVPRGVPSFDPFIRYHTFGDSQISFTLILRANEFVDQYLIKHECIKRLHARYAQENIVIPYPIRAINYTQEK